MAAGCAAVKATARTWRPLILPLNPTTTTPPPPWDHHCVCAISLEAFQSQKLQRHFLRSGKLAYNPQHTFSIPELSHYKIGLGYILVSISKFISNATEFDKNLIICIFKFILKCDNAIKRVF